MIKHYIFRIILILTLGLLMSNCNEESYIQGEGYLTETEGEVDNTKGSITIFTNTPFACSDGLVVYIDGEAKGTLREQKISGTPNCGEKSNSAVTFLLSAGSHKIEVRGSDSVFCPKYGGTFVTVEKGRCSLLRLGS
jgi:hypothetical protein